MKKLTRFLFLCLFVVVFCTACNGDITRDIRHAGFSMSGEFACSNFFPKDKEDVNYEKIKYMTSSHIINTEGKIYELSLSQNFANDENCKVADTPVVVQAIFDSSIVKGTDGLYYYLTAQNELPAYSVITAEDNSYEVYDLLLRDADVVKVVTVDSNLGLYYVLKTDGNVYSYTLSRADRNLPLEIIEVAVVYSTLEYGKIIDFNYAGDSLSTFIKSEDKVYRMRGTNSEECNKYADIECKFKLNKDPTFETYKDVIISYNGTTLITNYKQIFTVAS